MKRICLFLLAAPMILGNSLAFADSPGPVLNQYPAYPASCLADPLPTTPNGPTWQARVTLDAIQFVPALAITSEDVTFFFWRTPCNAGKSALLGRLVRDPANQGRADVQPLFPFFAQAQNGQDIFFRAALEPNTAQSFIYLNPTGKDTTFVFENGLLFPTGTKQIVDYSDSFELLIQDDAGDLLPLAAIPAYDAGQYPNASLPMQISGYQSGNYSDPAGSQGIQIEVIETGVQGQRALVLAWYTYDATGTSYWLFNSTTFSAGARSVSLPLGYFVGGGFAGATGNVSGAEWGTVSLSFTDCNHMNFSYQSLSGLPAGVPVGSGSKTFSRVTSINGITCDSP
jgi:hypothetical protein